jgi:hypothetical protein
MSPEVNILIIVSIVGLLLVLGLWAKNARQWRSLIAITIAVVAFALLLNRVFGFPETPVSAMGLRGDFLLWLALYVSMLLGMFAQYAFRHFDRPRRRRTEWDWHLFLAPVFASPLVFLPLATSFISAGLDLESLTAPRLMIFFVAFENGFFWKEFFDLKRREAADRT